MTWEPELEELRRREAMARELGGVDKVQRQHDGGRLTVRERIDSLVDAESFHEIGAIAGKAEYGEDGSLARLTPSNFVFGRAALDGRPVVVVSPAGRYGHKKRRAPERGARPAHEMLHTGWLVDSENSFRGQLSITSPKDIRKVVVTIAGTEGDARVSVVITERE